MNSILTLYMFDNVSGLVAVLSILFLPTFVHIGGSVGVMRKWYVHVQ